MSDPPIPERDWNRIREEALSGRYGAPGELTRASVILVTRALKLQKYRERWKTILHQLNPEYEPEKPSDEFLRWAEDVFPHIVRTFNQNKSLMPHSVVRTKEGRVLTRQRHNFPSYNYIQRKLLEACGTWDFHHEFPVPRSHNKLHALDDITEKMFEILDIPFQRSCVIKLPKFKKFH